LNLFAECSHAWNSNFLGSENPVKLGKLYPCC
jgi:hypothetical protein